MKSEPDRENKIEKTKDKQTTQVTVTILTSEPTK